MATRITHTEIKTQVRYVNEYVLENSIYKIVLERHTGRNWLYLHTREKEGKRLRLLVGGTSRELWYFLSALELRHRYMQEPF